MFRSIFETGKCFAPGSGIWKNPQCLLWGCGMLTLLALLTGLVLPSAKGGEATWMDLLDRASTGAARFVDQHPTWDGRGVVVAVLDTGVDPSVPGLQRCPDGSPKVLEARDFTGQGDLKLDSPEEASENGEPILKVSQGVVRGAGALQPPPNQKTWLLGFLKEESFRNSAVRDLDDDGETNGSFAVLLGETPEGWRYWVDSDGDGNLADEVARQDYGLAQEVFLLGGRGGEESRPPLAFSAHLIPKKKLVQLHFADGSHGTHVAGIAAGYQIAGRRGFDGVAPGAQVLSLKIGDNTLAGGSTRTGSMLKALKFAARWSKRHNTPVVANISYGIGSEGEGRSEIEEELDQLLLEYPLLTVAVSAGNAGPGLSSAGTPGGASLAFTAGALLTRANAEALYGERPSRDLVFHFSSRGGEVPKPDGLTPGAAFSTVPAWEWGGVMRGTSMASPHAAGCLALLASAARDQKLEIHGPMLVAALRNSASPLEGYSLLDQGPGVVNVPRAFDLLKSLAGLDWYSKVAGFRVQTPCPGAPEDSAPAAMFRTGTWLPDDAQEVQVDPLFFKAAKAADRDGFFEHFDLSTQAPWLSLERRSVFLKKEEGGQFNYRILADKLKKPGLYTASIVAVPRSLGGGPGGRLFEVWVSVVVPEVFGLGTDLSREFAPETLAPGALSRRFLRVPEGASEVEIGLLRQGGQYCLADLQVFDQAGREVKGSGVSCDSRGGRSALLRLGAPDLVPGVYEVVVAVPPGARQPSTQRLTVSVGALACNLQKSFSFDPGQRPRSAFRARVLLDRAFAGNAEGVVQGYRRDRTLTLEEGEAELAFTMDEGMEAVDFELTLSREDYLRFTDVAVNILDETGEAVEKGGFTQRFASLSLGNHTKTKAGYRLQVVGAFAGEAVPVKVKLRQSVRLLDRPALEVSCSDSSYFTIYPFTDALCDLEMARPPRAAPDGFAHWGALWFKDGKTGRVVLRRDFNFGLGQEDQDK